MNTRNIGSIYAIFVGVSMISMWLFFYFSNSIPELETEPVRISMHIMAEIITSIVLIAGGIGIWKNKPWGKNMGIISMGMLIYTLIQSPGYFIELEEYPMVIMFAILFVLAVYFSINLVFTESDQR